MKYSYFNNHEDQMSYTVIHAEDGTETFIAICDSAEKADFITKACNQFSLSPDPTPEVGNQIEKMADETFAASEAIMFADWLLENEAKPNGFGGWGTKHANSWGTSSIELYRVFKSLNKKK